jgi:hypothetical protein
MAASYCDWRGAPARACFSIAASEGTALIAGGGTAQGLRGVQGRMGRRMVSVLLDSLAACGGKDWFALARA